MNVKPCEVCGEVFAAKSSRSRYCPNAECKRIGRCRCAKLKRQRDPEAKARQRRYERESRARYPERNRARLAVKGAIKRGDLVKPDACSRCKRALPPARLQGHHAAGYAEENWLTVVWLCSACHREEDRVQAAGS